MKMLPGTVDALIGETIFMVSPKFWFEEELKNQWQAADTLQPLENEEMKKQYYAESVSNK